MKARVFPWIVFQLLLLSVVGGCGTAQRVDVNLPDQYKNRMFRVGVVKAAIAGDLSTFGFGGYFVEKKKDALARIPLDEIITTLNEYYGLEIERNIDRTPMVVMEEIGSNQPFGVRNDKNKHPTESAYYGNLEFDNKSILWPKNPGGADNALPNVVNVTYWMEDQSLGVKTAYCYEIRVKSAGRDVLALKGVMGTVTGHKGWFGRPNATGWDLYISHAGQIADALRRDLSKASVAR